MNLDTVLQMGIIIFGCSAIWLVGRPESEPWRRWGFICGLCSQPFWLAMSIKDGKWGVLLVSCWYSYGWAQGVWFHWLKPELAIQQADLGDGEEA